MERQFFSGNTVEQAILAAARHYGLDPDRVAYRLRDKKHGFLNIRRRVVIEVDPEAPERSEEAGESENEIPGGVDSPAAVTERVSAPAASAPVVSAPFPPERSPHIEPAQRPQPKPSMGIPAEKSWRGEESSWTDEGHQDREIAALETALDKILDLMDIDLDMSIESGDEGFEIELLGSDEDLPMDERGKVLDAVEHLLPRMFRGLIGHGTQCRVDFKGFRATHELGLRRLAEQAAEEVRRGRQEQKLDPMNPSDRRLVHMALAEDSTVQTESEGEGFLKRVRILPADAS